MKRVSFILMLTYLCTLSAMGKAMITVHGVVYHGSTKQVIVGALIKDKNSQNSTTTDVDGQFIMNVEEGTTLQVSSIGYATKNVKVKSPHLTIYLGKEKGIGFSIKPFGEFGLVNNFVANTPSFGDIDVTGSMSRFGVDFGYSFLRKQGWSLDLSAGVAYSPMSTTIDKWGETFYSYAAPPSADMDGESYERYYELSPMQQKVDIGYLTVPVYLSAGYKVVKWIGIHIDAGVNLNFKISSKLSKVEGISYSYGIYPQYGDLMINAPYMNGFGESNLADSNYEAPLTKSLYASLFAGVGIEFYVYGPLSIDVSARYDMGLTDIYEYNQEGYPFTMNSAPVYYEVSSGQSVRSWTSSMKESKLNQLSLRVGLNFRF